ncbi:MAG: ATP-binding protein [Ardenticatenaceae bacterium]|nr:ATP-binding protein [Ardenticatenaceae bacterium]
MGAPDSGRLLSAKPIARTFADIAHALAEPTVGTELQLRQALELLRRLVAHDRCALLEALPGRSQRLTLLSELCFEGQPVLEQRMNRWLQLLREHAAAGGGPNGPELRGSLPCREYVTIPLVGLDQVIGLLFVGRVAPAAFDEEDLSLVSVVAAQLAAHLVARWLWEEAAQRTRDLEASQRRLAFLTEVGALLVSSLDYETTLQRVAQLTVPQFADWCTVDLVAEDGTIQSAAVIVHAGPEKEALVREMLHRSLPGEDPPMSAAQVIATGKPIVVTQLPEALRTPRNAELAALIRRLAPTSWIIAPLLVRGQILGALTFARSEWNSPYSADDLTLAEELARRAAMAIENARLYQGAQGAIRLRDRFLSIASHELKTPLTTIQGYADLLARREGRQETADPRQQRAIEMIQAEAVRLQNLIDLLLDGSRLHTDQLQIEPAPMDLAALVRRYVEQVRPTLEHHILTQALPAEPVLVAGDQIRLEQVVQNLISNAIKYSPDGGPITVRLERQSRIVALMVSDRGIGVPAEKLSSLFQPFYRADNARARHIHGVGLGLAVVKEIVTRHGGTIAVESREGEGTTFTVFLPLLPET